MALIRRMLQEDTPAIRAIEERISIEPWSEKLFKDCITVGYSCWVIEENNLVIGYGLMSCAICEAHILNLAIDIDFQGRGFGNKILRHLISDAVSNDADIIYLEVRESNSTAKRMYEKFKFVEIGSRKDYYPTKDGKENAIVLAMSINK